MTIHKSGSSSNLPSYARCVRTITTRQTKWNDYTQKWKLQQLAFMCEVCAYYNNKANEMKWLYTNVEAAATRHHVRDVYEMK